MRTIWISAVLGATLLVTGAAPSGAQADDDLTRALLSGGRQFTEPPAATDLEGIRIGTGDTAARPRTPMSACWRGDELAIADLSRRMVLVFAESGRLLRTIGSRGTGPGQFMRLSMVRCSAGDAAFLAADLGTHRLSFFDSSGALLHTARTPDVPQIDILGGYALMDDGTWFESWLGTDVPIGPYLSPAQWRGVPLVRRFGASGDSIGAFGQPKPYEDRVARRVLNRLFMTIASDTLWTLTQGDATVRAFLPTGEQVLSDIQLPVYFRGRDPKVELGKGHPASDFLPNRMAYDPNVQDVAVVLDSLLLTARYADWGFKLVTEGGIALQRMARSTLELANRRGEVVRAYNVPGTVLAVESDGARRVAVITRLRDDSRAVFIARLPR